MIYDDDFAEPARACADRKAHRPHLLNRTACARVAGVSLLAALTFALSACGGDDRSKQSGSGVPPRTHSQHSHAPAAASAPAATASSTAAASAFVVPASGEITISSDDRMRFDITEFVVKPGQSVTLTLLHTGRMPVNAMGHNIAILKAYTDLPAFARAAAGSAQTDYIPRTMRSQVIAHTKMLGGGQRDTITFTAPEQSGEYDFLCTFPMHFGAGMKGKMIVRE